MADMGVLPGNFFPQTAGPGYESTSYLDIIAAHRSRMTVFSGLSHQDNSDGHRSTRTFLSGAPQPTASNFKNTISIDQLVAEQVGCQTRFPSLPLLVGTIGTGTPSILRSGGETKRRWHGSFAKRKAASARPIASIGRRSAVAWKPCDGSTTTAAKKK